MAPAIRCNSFLLKIGMIPSVIGIFSYSPAIFYDIPVISDQLLSFPLTVRCKYLLFDFPVPQHSDGVLVILVLSKENEP